MTDVLQLGAHSLGAVWPIVVAALNNGKPLSLSILRREDTFELKYVETVDPLELLQRALEAGDLTSIQGRSVGGTLVGVYAPRFAGGGLNQWLCVIEASDALLSESYERVLQRDEITFVSLSLDEPVELEMADVHPGTFPWGDWRLKRAAVRDANGAWEERHGPAAQSP